MKLLYFFTFELPTMVHVYSTIHHGRALIISLLQEGQPIIADLVKYEVKQRVDPDSVWEESLLHVNEVQPADYGIYTCIVTNAKGTDRLPILFEDASEYCWPERQSCN